MKEKVDEKAEKKPKRKKLNSIWGKSGLRYDPKMRYPCHACGEEHTYMGLIDRHAREGYGWRNGAKLK